MLVFYNYQFETSETDLSTSFVEAVRQHDAFADGGGLYSARTLVEAFSAESGAVSNYNKDEKGNPLVQLFGADDFLLESMEAVEGTIDWEALKSGGYVLYGLACDDKGNVIDNPAIRPGDTLRFHHVSKAGLTSTIDGTFDLTVMAKVRINENTDTTRNTGESRFYLPTGQFLPLCEQPHMVSYPFNVKDGTEADMEVFLSSYVENVEPRMHYDSRETYISSFHDLTSLTVTIGGALSIIVGFIGIANFINSVLTSIIIRRKEFAMLQSIGMTGKQLKRMLAWEGGILRRWYHHRLGCDRRPLFRRRRPGHRWRDLVFHLPVHFLADAGGVPVLATADNGHSHPSVPGNRKGQYH